MLNKQQKTFLPINRWECFLIEKILIKIIEIIKKLYPIFNQFFEKVKQIKEENGYDSIELQVNAKNQMAYEMYKNYGFTEKSINMELKFM